MDENNNYSSNNAENSSTYGNNDNTYGSVNSSTYGNNDNTYGSVNSGSDGNAAYGSDGTYRYGRYQYGDTAYQTFTTDSGTSGGYSGYGNASSLYPTPKKKSVLGRAMRFLLSAACFGLIAGCAFYGVNYLADHYLPQNAVNESSGSEAQGSGSYLSSSHSNAISIATTELNGVTPYTEDGIVVQVVEENMDATVIVKSTYTQSYYYFGKYYQEEVPASGSGFIVGINDKELLIATNNHVISDATKIEVTFSDDTTLEAVVKGTDSLADLAIIAVPLSTIKEDTMSKIRIATLGNSDEVKVGEMAIAIGNALGYGQSVTVGYISAKDREVSVDNNTMILLQTDAAINKGNSGGPLLNTKGEVIGINSVKYTDTSVEGMCFAIPISRAIPILNELMNRETLLEEEQGYLGIEPKTVTDEIASFYGWPTGVYVSRVLADSAAEAAGLYVGDIITSINGVQVITAEQLKAAVTSYRYGTTLELVVKRNVNGRFEEKTLSVTLMKRPVSE